MPWSTTDKRMIQVTICSNTRQDVKCVFVMPQKCLGLCIVLARQLHLLALMYVLHKKNRHEWKLDLPSSLSELAWCPWAHAKSLMRTKMQRFQPVQTCNGKTNINLSIKKTNLWSKIFKKKAKQSQKREITHQPKKKASQLEWTLRGRHLRNQKDEAVMKRDVCVCMHNLLSHKLAKRRLVEQTGVPPNHTIP